MESSFLVVLVFILVNGQSFIKLLTKVWFLLKVNFHTEISTMIHINFWQQNV